MQRFGLSRARPWLVQRGAVFHAKLENQGDFQSFAAEPAARRRRAGIFDHLGGGRQVKLGLDQALIAAFEITAAEQEGEKCPPPR